MPFYDKDNVRIRYEEAGAGDGASVPSGRKDGVPLPA